MSAGMTTRQNMRELAGDFFVTEGKQESQKLREVCYTHRHSRVFSEGFHGIT